MANFTLLSVGFGFWAEEVIPSVAEKPDNASADLSHDRVLMLYSERLRGDKCVCKALVWNEDSEDPGSSVDTLQRKAVPLEPVPGNIQPKHAETRSLKRNACAHWERNSTLKTCCCALSQHKCNTSCSCVTVEAQLS